MTAAPDVAQSRCASAFNSPQDDVPQCRITHRTEENRHEDVHPRQLNIEEGQHRKHKPRDDHEIKKCRGTRSVKPLRLNRIFGPSECSGQRVTVEQDDPYKRCKRRPTRSEKDDENNRRVRRRSHLNGTPRQARRQCPAKDNAHQRQEPRRPAQATSSPPSLRRVHTFSICQGRLTLSRLLDLLSRVQRRLRSGR
jgi:hypothetical protein